MHTKVIKVAGFDDFRIHHNSDWSGDAILSWVKAGEVRREVVCPGDLVRALADGATARPPE